MKKKISKRQNKYIHKIKDKVHDKTVFIILCARKSSRRGCRNIPLMKINKTQTIIDNQIQTINNTYSNNEIILVSGFEHNRLVEHIHNKSYNNIRIIENQAYKDSSVIDGWRIGMNACVPENTYIIHGDRIFTSNCISNNNEHNFLITHTSDKHNYNLGILSKHDNELMNVSYGLPNVWSEIFFLNKTNFLDAKEVLNNCEKYKLYSIEQFINYFSDKITTIILKKKKNDVKTLKELL